MQTQLAILCTHSLLTAGQPFQALTTHRPAPGRVGTSVSMVKGLPWTGRVGTSVSMVKGLPWTGRVGTTVSMDWQGTYCSVHGEGTSMD